MNFRFQIFECRFIRKSQIPLTFRLSPLQTFAFSDFRLTDFMTLRTFDFTDFQTYCEMSKFSL